MSATPIAPAPARALARTALDAPLAWRVPSSVQPPAGPEPSFEALAQLERRLRVQAGPGAATASGPTADQEPDWADARRACEQLLESSRDLRAAVGWTRCSLTLDGLPGLAAGLAGIADLLEAWWPALHPVVDMAEDPSANERRHLLLDLSPDAARAQPTRETESLARALRAARVGTNAQREPMAVRDLDHGTLAWSEECAAVGRSVDQALAALQRIEGTFVRETGHGLRLPGLQRTLERVARAAVQAAATHAAATTAPGSDADPDPVEALLVGLQGDRSGAPSSRADAARRLAALASWVRQHEPSSPAPLLIERAAALLQMDFAEIVRTLLPAARSQVEAIAGVPLDPDPR